MLITMHASVRATLIFLTLLIVPRSVVAAPQVAMQPQSLVVTAQEYRLTFHRYRSEFRLELRDGRGQWQAVTKPRTQPEFAVVDAQGVHTSLDGPARLRHVVAGEAIVVGLTTVLPNSPPTIARVHFICTDDGLLIQFAPEGQAGDATAACWALPRLALDETLFDAYAYWRGGRRASLGRIADLGTPTVYAGVSPWGNQGDTAPRLSPRHPALLARSRIRRSGPGRRSSWTIRPAGPTAHSFLQAYSRDQLYFYPAIAAREAATKDGWAWLAPMPVGCPGRRREDRATIGARQRLVAGFQPIAPEPEEQWTAPAGLPRGPAPARSRSRTFAGRWSTRSTRRSCRTTASTWPARRAPTC